MAKNVIQKHYLKQLFKTSKRDYFCYLILAHTSLEIFNTTYLFTGQCANSEMIDIIFNYRISFSSSQKEVLFKIAVLQLCSKLLENASEGILVKFQVEAG